MQSRLLFVGGSHDFPFPPASFLSGYFRPKVPCRHRSYLILSVQPQAVQLGAGQLDHPDVITHDQTNDFGKLTRQVCCPIRDRILIQQAVSQHNDFFASVIGEHVDYYDSFCPGTYATNGILKIL